MAKATKFGTFAGVFTPSILTILGVIMYLRLGWVVGEGGLIMTIGIIMLAHIISVSTGLSISSIATDKKIKTGGIYYILSRSLGLPMGGAIGITLFIGTALSISLYIVGFTENLISVAPWLHEAFGFESKANLIRIIGTIVICFLVMLAFISTSLVIKTQYFILGAIGLSLLSIVFGFFSLPDSETGGAILSAASEGSSFEDLFKVFFPAVTGFTAGVAMSGDLKDPKKAIPRGTMLSIVVGFVVYILLAIGIALFVDRQLLLEDTNFLMKIAWFSPFVVMGIWGATLSSALGGILGGPRILQAIANDKIMPLFLGKGYGASNEPRNALIIIFLIAEIGILIGELNAIAGVVSMFYLASYGFINLAFSLENWASTDFRPSFKISPWIGFIGFIACFAIMFKLDTVSMFAALIIMSLIFLVLKRKEFRSDAGDVWQSVWTSVVRNALHKMEKNPMEERNWQPNIILFSGGSSRRPYLVEFGKALVGKFGMLSNFDLIEKRSSEILFPKHKQAIKKDKTDKGIFYRRQTCKDIYQGIEVIASTYGFSGIEPNTILMGWARQSKDPVKFASLIRNLYKLDLNILLMDYDKRFGFGDKKTIDIWWRGEGHNNNLALFLAKFLMANNDWEQAKIRLIIVNSISELNEKLYQKANYVLENLRITAEVKILNNQLDNRHIYDIISDESRESSMVFLGIPQIDVNKEQEFVDNTNKLLKDVGTVVLVKASSFFMQQKFISAQSTVKKLQPIIEDIDEKEIVSPLEKYGLRIDFSEKLSAFFDELKQVSDKIKKEYFETQSLEMTELVTNYIEKQIVLLQNLSEIKSAAFDQSETIIENIYEHSEMFFDNLSDLALKNTDNQKTAIQYYQGELLRIINEMPDNLYVKYEKEELESNAEDDTTLKRYKRKLRLEKGIKGNGARNKVKFKKILRKRAPHIAQSAVFNFIEKWESNFYEIIVQLNKALQYVLFSIPAKAADLKYYKGACKLNKSEYNEAAQILNSYHEIKSELIKYLNKLKQGLDFQIEDNLSQLFNNLDINNYIKQNKLEKEDVKKLEDGLGQLPEKWNLSYLYFFNEIKLDNVLGKTKIRLYQLLQWLYFEINKIVKEKLETRNQTLKKDIQSVLTSIKKEESFNQTKHFTTINALNQEDIFVFNKPIERCNRIINNLVNSIPNKIELLDDVIFSDLNLEEVEVSKTYTILANRLTEGIVSNELTSLFQDVQNKLGKEIRSIDSEIINQNRLIRYTIFKEEEDEKNGESEEVDIQSFLENKLNGTKKINEKINEIGTGVYKQLLEGFYEVNDKLQLYNFKREANNWNQYLPKATAKTSISKVKKIVNSIGNFIDRQLDEFWYRQSDAILLADDLSNKNESTGTSVYKLLNTVENASISKKVLSELPFFYKHLFLNKSYFNNDFWIGRKNELQRAISAYNRFKEGFAGALLVRGESNSGKSFMIRHLCSSQIETPKTIYINPPETTNDFTKQLQKFLQTQSGIKGDVNKIINKLETGSIIVFEDIELWWEKSENGNQNLVELFSIIETHSSRIFFILSLNNYSYRIIRKMLHIESMLLDTISCKPMNTRTLQEIVLFRHKASGLKFKLDKNSTINGKSAEEDFKSRHFAILFSKYFNYSKGNIGTCLLAWMASITEIKEHQITMKLPKTINTNEFEKLDKDTVLLLYQLVLHKKMDIAKLSRVMLENESNIKPQLDFLIRTGIVTKTNNTYEINVYFYTQIISVLKNFDML